jgi:PIN domain nuclease of toxin-antitoxin system
MCWMPLKAADAVPAGYPPAALGPDDPGKLSDPTRKAIEDPDNDVLFSTASIWEVAIKVRQGLPDFALRAETIATESIWRGFAELMIRWQAAAVAADLPLHHRDPFDRILLAQAVTEPVHFYAVDRKLTPYSPLVVLA